MKRHRGRMPMPMLSKKRMGQTLIKQVILCIIIILLVIIAKRMDIAIVNKAVETFHTQITKDYTAKDIANTAKSAFNQVKDSTVTIVASLRGGEKAIEFAPPSDEDGTLSVSAAGDGGKTMFFLSDEEIQVYAAAGGTVSEIGTLGNTDKYIKITHGNDIISLYGGCTEVYVQALEKVRKGQIIGTVAAGEERHLSFEVWVDGELKDPTDYIVY